MAVTYLAKPMYIFINLDNNNISAIGIKELGSLLLPKLQ